MWHTMICTASEWENFFALRAHSDAEIHIQELAYKMLDEYNAHTPKQLKAGEWHIPFGDNIQMSVLDQHDISTKFPSIKSKEDLKIRIATARCARVSYLNFEGKDDYAADIKLHDRLLESGHMSPFEHCARAMNKDEYKNNSISTYDNIPNIGMEQDGWCGNFRGFIQYRKMLAGENKIDNRVNK